MARLVEVSPLFAEHRIQMGVAAALYWLRSPSVVLHRALATVEVPPLFAGHRIQIGWIQVCRDMTFVNSYGREGL